MTRKQSSAFPRRVFARVLPVRLALLERRAQGKPGADCARSPVCEECYRKAHGLNYRYSQDIPAFPAQWLYGLYVLSPVSGVSCHRRRQDIFHQLDATVAAPGPHDFAVRCERFRPVKIT